MWKFLLPFVAFVALAVLFAFGLNPNRDIHALPSPLIGKAAPSFSLTDVLDPAGMVSNSDSKARCTCSTSGAPGATLAGRSMRRCSRSRGSTSCPSSASCTWISATTRKAWLEQLGNPYTAVAIDTDGRTAIDWGVYGAPETFLVDGEGGSSTNSFRR